MNVSRAILNSLRHGSKNLIMGAINGPFKPRWIWFGVTERCNSRCSYCNIWKKEPERNELSAREIEDTFSDPIFSNLECVINSGGEPSLRDDMEAVLLSEHKVLPKARLQLSTNGLLPERVLDIVKFAVKHDICLDVGTSLDAIGSKHDAGRGVKGNFEKVDWLLRELISLRDLYGPNRISPTFGFTLTDRTMTSLDEVREYSQDLGIDFLVQWYNQSSFYGNEEKDLAVSNNAMMNVVKSLPCSMLNEMWIKRLHGKSGRFRCFAMRTFAVLKCNGDLAPCLSLWDQKAGNVRNNSPSEIWNSSESQNARACVDKCGGCLNSWGVGWSINSSFYPYVPFYLKHPRSLLALFK